MHCALEGSRIAQIAGDVLQREIGDSAIVTGRPQKHAYLVAARNELAGDVTPEEGGGASEQSSHVMAKNRCAGERRRAGMSTRSTGALLVPGCGSRPALKTGRKSGKGDDYNR